MENIKQFNHSRLNSKVLGLLLLSAITPISAEEYDNSLSELSLQELLSIKISVASIKQESTFDAPSSVTVFSKRQIENMGIESVEELLNLVPGFHASRRVELGQGYTVSARGRSTAQSSFDILFLLDGQRLNTEWSGGALFFNRYLSLDNVKQVEVIRGPGSALYGSNAFSGVVNIVTDTTLNQLKFSAGSFSQNASSLQYSASNEEFNWSIFAKYYQDDGDDYSADEFLAINTSDPWQGSDLSIQFAAADWGIQLRHMQRELEDFYQFGRFVNNEVNFYESEQTNLNVNYQWDLGEQSSITANIDYISSSRDGLIEVIPAIGIQNLPPTIITSGNQAFIGGPVADEHNMALRLDGQWTLSKNHELFAGIHYREADIEKLRNNSNYDFGDFVNAFILQGPPPTGQFRYLNGLLENSAFGLEAKRDVTGIYIQDKWQISEVLDATLGLRHDDYSDYGASTSPRVAFVYSADKTQSFKLMYGEAFRAPSWREVTTMSNPVVVGNPDLEPEEIKTAELAWLYSSGSIQTGLTYFHSSIKNIIQQVPIGSADPRNTYVNSGEQDTGGFEFELKWDILENLNLISHYLVLQEKELAPVKFPDHTGSIMINYHVDRFNINLNGHYVGDTQSLVRSGTSVTQIIGHDSYFHLNAKASYRWENGWMVAIAVSNIAEGQYRSATNTPELGKGVPNRDTSTRIELQYDF